MRPFGRLLVAGALAGFLGVQVAAPAVAAPDASISDVEARGEKLTGVLTFRDAGVVEVDPEGFTATVDGEEHPASASGSSTIERTSMLVIDTSGSMGDQGMATVRSAAREYLAEVPDDVHIGVTTFADTATVGLAPTRDRSKVQRTVDRLVATGDTSLYAAVSATTKELGADGDRSMVLLSDGADTVSARPSADLTRTTKALRGRGIRVDVVRFNTDDPGASTALAGFARAGGGSVIAADDAGAVGDAFQTAARALKSQATFEIETEEELTGAHTLRLEGTAGGAPFAVEQRVELSGATTGQAAPASSERDPLVGTVAAAPAAALPSSLWVWLGVLALGGAFFLFTFGALSPSVQTPRERRLAMLESHVVGGPAWSPQGEARPAEPLSERLVRLGERVMRRRGSTARTMQLIARADLPLRAGEWFVLCLVAVVVGVAAGVVLLPGAKLLGVVLGVVAGAVLPQVVLRFLAARRARAFERVLPQSLVLVSTSLRSGFGLMQSLDAVAEDSAAPVDKEFSRALAETRIGTDIADALERMAERMGSEAMAMAVMAIRIQREVGGNLAETLETTAHTLREREALFGQMRALSAEGRLSAQILIGLPIALLLYMLMVNREYVSLLWTTSYGVMMSLGGIVLMLLGIVWMRNVVKIEV